MFCKITLLPVNCSIFTKETLHTSKSFTHLKNHLDTMFLVAHHWAWLFVFTVSMETVTLCSHSVFVMSERKAIIPKATYKIQNDSIPKQGVSLLRFIHCLPFQQFVIWSQKKFCKKRVIVVIGMLHNRKVECDLLCQKMFFLYTSSMLRQLSSMCYNMKVKHNLMLQINKHHHPHQKCFFHARNHALLSPTKQVMFNGYMT